ncbi:MAG: peptidoglycan DD-metalloendopeptidase family protein [Alistipes sp.]|nr:peptidoglycan DD-metalloendopeptidase family protein [Alistipes sp.]
MKRLYYTIISLFIATAIISCSSKGADNSHEPNIIFGINADNYTLERKTVEKGESWSKILGNYGIGTQKLLRLDQLTKDICPLRNIRAGSHYTTFTQQDSTSVRLDYLVYEKTLIDYVVFAFVGDSISVREGQREVEIKRQKSTATINTSLWGAIMEAKLPYSLASEMEDIYQWTVDFFAIQQGDSFTVIYDEKFIDTLSVGVGRVWGVKFNHRGKEIYAIPFEQGGKLQYWEADGGSLRKQLLKAPLKFTRISSKFSHARLHPVTRKVRPHHGVDYAAPIGTPVRAVADGVVTVKTRKKADGNILKIKHPGNLSSGYLHLKGFAKGINVGTRVSQGQVIGYVGSTGYSTGPHLDFRLWKGNTPINPLNVPQKPAEPIAKSNREKFDKIKERVMAELNGEVPDSMKVTNLEIL